METLCTTGICCGPTLSLQRKVLNTLTALLRSIRPRCGCYGFVLKCTDSLRC